MIEHGCKRTTEVIDFELSLGPWDINQIRGLAEEIELQPKFVGAFELASRSLLLPLIHVQSGLGVDFAFSPSDYLDQAIIRAPRHRIKRYPVAVAAVEDLIIRKVIANRPLDRNDIEELLLRHAQRIDLAYMDRWLAQFEQLIDAPLRETFRELLEQSRQ